MTFYVTTSTLDKKGRDDLWLWSEMREIETEYVRGGWSDGVVDLILPHIVFKESEDAIAYSLRFGGQVYDKIPIKDWKSNYDGVEVDDDSVF
jgi:hypothetical protein